MSEKFSQSLLARSHSPQTASQVYRDKIAHRPLLLRPTSPSPKTDNARTARQKVNAAKAFSIRKLHRPRPLSAKQKRLLSVYEIPESQRNYNIYIPLHHMWIAYMQDTLRLAKQVDGKLIKEITPQGTGQQLVSADFHGAEIEVIRSRCVGRVGLRGIVVRDTKFTFEIITNSSELKSVSFWFWPTHSLADSTLVVPKEHTIFRFEIPLPSSIQSTGKEEDKMAPLVFELNGSQLETSAPGRATKKFKMHVDQAA